MSKNQYTVSLTAGQRRSLKRLIQNDNAPDFKVRNARVLLKGDRGKKTDKAIARELNINVTEII
jgi:hypothetical protein